MAIFEITYTVSSGTYGFYHNHPSPQALPRLLKMDIYDFCIHDSAYSILVVAILVKVLFFHY